MTGTKRSAILTSSGFVSKLGNQKLSFVPKAGTRIMGPGDVAGFDAASKKLTITASAGPVGVGNHVFVRPAKSVPWVAKVTAIANGSNGTRVLTVTEAILADAFLDYEASYHGSIREAVPVGRISTAAVAGRTGEAAEPAAGGGILGGLNLLDGHGVTCNIGGNAAEVIDVAVTYDGNTNLDVSLRRSTVDFSMTGRIKVVVSFLGGQSVGCTVEGPKISIPIGTTGVSLILGAEGSFEFTTADAAAGGLFSVTGGPTPTPPSGTSTASPAATPPSSRTATSSRTSTD